MGWIERVEPKAIAVISNDLSHMQLILSVQQLKSCLLFSPQADKTSVRGREFLKEISSVFLSLPDIRAPAAASGDEARRCAFGAEKNVICSVWKHWTEIGHSGGGWGGTTWWAGGGKEKLEEGWRKGTMCRRETWWKKLKEETSRSLSNSLKRWCWLMLCWWFSWLSTRRWYRDGWYPRHPSTVWSDERSPSVMSENVLEHGRGAENTPTRYSPYFVLYVKVWTLSLKVQIWKLKSGFVASSCNISEGSRDKRVQPACLGSSEAELLA